MQQNDDDPLREVTLEEDQVWGKRRAGDKFDFTFT